MQHSIPEMTPKDFRSCFAKNVSDAGMEEFEDIEKYWELNSIIRQGNMKDDDLPVSKSLIERGIIGRTKISHILQLEMSGHPETILKVLKREGIPSLSRMLFERYPLIDYSVQRVVDFWQKDGLCDEQMMQRCTRAGALCGFNDVVEYHFAAAINTLIPLNVQDPYFSSMGEILPGLRDLFSATRKKIGNLSSVKNP